MPYLAWKSPKVFRNHSPGVGHPSRGGQVRARSDDDHVRTFQSRPESLNRI